MPRAVCSFFAHAPCQIMGQSGSTMRKMYGPGYGHLQFKLLKEPFSCLPWQRAHPLPAQQWLPCAGHRLPVQPARSPADCCGRLSAAPACMHACSMGDSHGSHAVVIFCSYDLQKPALVMWSQIAAVASRKSCWSLRAPLSCTSLQGTCSHAHVTCLRD